MPLCKRHAIAIESDMLKILPFSLPGMRKTHIKTELEKYLLLVELDAKSQPCNMSSSSKRKLSVCIALCGDSNIVLVDEPSEGMNLWANQLVWQLLRREKCGRTILICTSYADEADLLGDRIAILSNGRMECCGSPQFLKKHYGYNLICEKAHAHCNVKQIETILNNQYGTVMMKKNTGTELTYMLADEASESLVTCNDTLEYNLKGLGLKSFELSAITMDEVLMTVGKEKLDQTQVKKLCNQDTKKTKSM